jgi:hypothetical protein
MSDLKETLADVTALVPRYSWEIMDEEQRDELMAKIVLPRYKKTTADGVKLGPSAWAEMFGVPSADTIRKRVERLKEGQERLAGKRTTSEPEWVRVDRRAMKRQLRESDPEELAEILRSDQKIATNVAKAAIRSQEIREDEVRREQKERAPELVHRAGFNEIAGDLVRIKRTYGVALKKARELELDDEEAEALAEQITGNAGINAISDWFLAFLQSGSRGFDQDLEDLLAEGR